MEYRADLLVQRIVDHHSHKGCRALDQRIADFDLRTFLSWLHFTVILGGLSIGLLNFGDDKVGRISGVLFTVIAMGMYKLVTFSSYSYTDIDTGIMVYALWLYLWRAHKIRTRSAGPYESRSGPVFVVVVLFAAMLVNFGLKMTMESENGAANRNGTYPDP